jgi:hypothetical protein
MEHFRWEGVELVTEELKTPFVAKALMAKRKTSKCPVIIFMGKDKSGELKECSRCYEENWGCYFNHLVEMGKESACIPRLWMTGLKETRQWNILEMYIHVHYQVMLYSFSHSGI